MIFCENCGHGRCPHKDSNIKYFCKYCDHGRTPIKTHKHDIFMRTAIMFAIIINSAFCDDCDHSHSPLYCDHFLKTASIVAVLRNRAFSKRFTFFEAITKGCFHLSLLMRGLALDKRVHILIFKKEVAEIEKIMREFFLNYGLT